MHDRKNLLCNRAQASLPTDRAVTAMTLPEFFRLKALRLALLGLTLAVAMPLPAAAQSPLGAVAKQAKGNTVATPDRQATPESVDDLKKRLADAQVELAAVDSPERQASGAPPGTPEQQLQLRVRMLRLMTFSYRQHLNALGNLAEQQKLVAEAEARRRTWTGLTEKPPYSILLVDRMRSELQANLLTQRSEEMRSRLLAAQTENTRETLNKASERNRRAQEALEAAKPAELATATWRRDLAALEVRALGAYLEGLAAQARSVEAYAAESGRAVEFVRRKIAEVEKSVIFKPEDLDRLKSDIDERRSATIKELDRATRERERQAAELDKAIEANATAEKQVVDLQEKHAAAGKALAAAEAEVAKAEKPEGLLQKINPFRGRSAKADLDARRKDAAEADRLLNTARSRARALERELLLTVERNRNAVQAVDGLNVGLVTLDMQRAFWDLRFSSAEGDKTGALDRRKNFENSRRLLNVINPATDHLRTKLAVVTRQIAEQQNLLRIAGDSAESAFLKGVLELLTERERSYLRAFTQVEEAQHLLQRWVEEEEIRGKDLSAGQRVQNLFGFSSDWMKAAWTFELFAVEDSIVVDGRTITGTRGVTVAKVVQAILIMVVGYLLVALLTRLAMGMAIRRGKLEETSARIARKWILAVTLVVLLLLALDVVKIPLTAFAFLGGAIAIGAGFGMQTLLKNLISGVMLLMERPFKPRDIVEVGGIRGEVTDINVRSCTIRDVNGIETLVPNSTFLEQNVTNWTLSSRKVRFMLNIGVGYGSPVRKVSDLLLEVAARHKQVLAEPEPEVLFMDFGDSALMFALYVWLEIGPGRRSSNVILSDLRFMIDASFAENGIEIPFPQREVHLNAASPMPVRMVPPESTTEKPDVFGS
jgi:small-conductance mechanosensitive channel